MGQAKEITDKKVLEVRDLKKSFGKLDAVVNVNLDLKQGECLALLGPNGAGKTTTCELIEGLITPDAGQIQILGQSLAHSRQDILQKIGIQLQETVLYQKYTVKETLELFASFYHNQVDLDALISTLGLSEKADVRLEKLSGGQKQRVNIACALVNSPQLVFLDEPTTGLDPHARRNLWEMIQGIKNEGRSIFLTTHYMEEAEFLADQVAIMDHGKIIALGSPRELIKKHGHAQMLWFTLSDSSEEARKVQVKRLSQSLPWLAKGRAIEQGWEIAIDNAPECLQELVRTADQLQISLSAMQMRQSTLEDVFLQLTGRSFKDA